MSNFASGYIKYINHLEQINDGAVHDPRRMIREVEESYRRNLESIAQDVLRYHKGVRMVMLSGPSSSGKTTTAKLLGALPGGGRPEVLRPLARRLLPAPGEGGGPGRRPPGL